MLLLLLILLLVLLYGTLDSSVSGNVNRTPNSNTVTTGYIFHCLIIRVKRSTWKIYEGIIPDFEILDWVSRPIKRGATVRFIQVRHPHALVSWSWYFKLFTSLV